MNQLVGQPSIDSTLTYVLHAIDVAEKNVARLQKPIAQPLPLSIRHTRRGRIHHGICDCFDTSDWETIP